MCWRYVLSESLLVLFLNPYVSGKQLSLDWIASLHSVSCSSFSSTVWDDPEPGIHLQRGNYSSNGHWSDCCINTWGVTPYQPLESLPINMLYGGIAWFQNKQVPILILHKNMTYRATVWLLREELTLPLFFHYNSNMS